MTQIFPKLPASFPANPPTTPAPTDEGRIHDVVEAERQTYWADSDVTIPNADGSVCHGGPAILCGSRLGDVRPDLPYGTTVCTLAADHDPDGMHVARHYNPDIDWQTWRDPAPTPADEARIHDPAVAWDLAHAEDTAWAGYESIRDRIAQQNAERLASGPSIIRRVLDEVAKREPEPRAAVERCTSRFKGLQCDLPVHKGLHGEGEEGYVWNGHGVLIEAPVWDDERHIWVTEYMPEQPDDAEPEGEPADISEFDDVYPASSQARLQTFVPALVQLDRAEAAASPVAAARASLAADLRRLARLAESGLLDGSAHQLSFIVEGPAAVQAIVDTLGGTTNRYKSRKDTIQASSTAHAGSIGVTAIVNTDTPWTDDAASDETWARLTGGAA